MEKTALYELLDMETAEDFQYFENIAELLESSEDIDGDLIYELLGEINLSQFGELVEQYFDEIEDWIPEGETEFFTLMDNIKRVYMGMVSSLISGDEEERDADDVLLNLADEIAAFRGWYNETDNVECINESTLDRSMIPVRDALAIAKAEKLGEDSHRFDFNQALEYELGEYVISFADLAELS